MENLIEQKAYVTIKNVYLDLECSNCHANFGRYLTTSSRYTGRKFITYTIDRIDNYYGLCNKCIKAKTGVEL